MCSRDASSRNLEPRMAHSLTRVCVRVSTYVPSSIVFDKGHTASGLGYRGRGVENEWQLASSVCALGTGGGQRHGRAQGLPPLARAAARGVPRGGRRSTALGRAPVPRERRERRRDARRAGPLRSRGRPLLAQRGRRREHLRGPRAGRRSPLSHPHISRPSESLARVNLSRTRSGGGIFRKKTLPLS